MNITELRIGNYVGSPMGDTFVYDTVRSIKNDELSLGSETLETAIVHPLKANPVELTVEWLNKFGFSQVSNSEFYEKSNPLFRISFDTSGYHHIGLVNFDKLKSVHQLQNLYFSITGKELKSEQ
jgi:hypothetical protein